MSIYSNINTAIGKVINTVGGINSLKAYRPSRLRDGDTVIVSGQEGATDSGGIYGWEETSTAVPDDFATVRPDFVTGKGRWLRIIGGRGPAGPAGPPGDGAAAISAPNGSTLVGYKSALPNTLQRTVFAKLSETVSVKDFGAKGDGTTDDRAAIQLAINTVSQAGGGTVHLPSGTYAMSWDVAQDGGVVCLLLKDNVTLVGDNMHTSVLKLKDGWVGPGTYLRIISTFGQVKNVQLLDFAVDGNRAGQGRFARQGNGGNIVIDVANCNIERVRSVEANGQGIQVRGSLANPSTGITIQNCRVSGLSGSSMDSAGNVTLEYNGNGIGIQVSQASDYKIINNSIRYCKDNGIDTYNDNPDGPATGGLAIIQGNVIQNSRCGIFPETSARMIISDNYISDMDEAGIAINRIHSAPDMITVSNNTIEYCVHGIRVTGNAATLRIADNLIGFITSGAGAGIYCENSSYVLIERNLFNILYSQVPLIAFTGAQAVFNLVSGNFYYNNPQPGYLTYENAVSNFGTVIEDWRSVSNLNARTNDEGMFFRPRASIDRLLTKTLTTSGTASLGPVGFNGSTPIGKVSLPADGSDLATTQALANAIKALLISYGLGV